MALAECLRQFFTLELDQFTAKMSWLCFSRLRTQSDKLTWESESNPTQTKLVKLKSEVRQNPTNFCSFSGLWLTSYFIQTDLVHWKCAKSLVTLSSYFISSFNFRLIIAIISGLQLNFLFYSNWLSALKVCQVTCYFMILFAQNNLSKLVQQRAVM